MPEIANVRVGKPQTSPAKPSHVAGVHEGNQPGRTWRERGIMKGRLAAKASSRRSTGINPHAHDPIDPRSPRLTPA
jgi:hypothetical protein